jgi:hypothetical protein
MAHYRPSFENYETEMAAGRRPDGNFEEQQFTQEETFRANFLALFTVLYNLDHWMNPLDQTKDAPQPYGQYPLPDTSYSLPQTDQDQFYQWLADRYDVQNLRLSEEQLLTRYTAELDALLLQFVQEILQKRPSKQLKPDFVLLPDGDDEYFEPSDREASLLVEPYPLSIFSLSPTGKLSISRALIFPDWEKTHGRVSALATYVDFDVWDLGRFNRSKRLKVIATLRKLKEASGIQIDITGVISKNWTR